MRVLSKRFASGVYRAPMKIKHQAGGGGVV